MNQGKSVCGSSEVERLERELSETKDKLVAALGALRIIRDAKAPAGKVCPSGWFEGYARMAAELACWRLT